MVQAGYDYSRQWEPRIEEEPRARRVKKTYKKVNIKRKVLIKLAGFAFIYGLVLVYICIKSATLGYQIVSLEQDLKNYEAANARLQYSIQESCSLDKVEQIAVSELGMSKPEKHVAVALSDPKVTIAPDNPDAEINTVSAAEEKPLYKLYTNLLLLAEKN